ncbi:MAG TPA: putative zinc-binding peptidase [Puia sp.]|nr:putative zinc-binding peptidase [Puia sp.]
MKVYTCSNCQNPLYFENSVCLNCRHAVGFDAVELTMITLKPESAGKSGIFSHVSKENELYKYCKNAEYGVCNWLLPASSASGFCIACTLNRVIPTLDGDVNKGRWKNLEVAKHRLIYSLLRLRLPFEVGGSVNGVASDAQRMANGARGATGDEKEESIAFDFMADTPAGERVVTGHDNGVITINIAEADEVQRVRNKQDLGERYRTLLGHFRHEIGHFYWDVLIRDRAVIDQFRLLFGDERQDYAAALATYYSNGAPADWNQHFVSPYAAAHPWEDWAETWAHYLHLMDTLETAWSFGLSIDPVEVDEGAGISASIVKDPYGVKDFNRLIKRWLPLCFAVNSLNRSMGHPDFYPFILSSPVIEKLRFIHGICQSGVKS